MHHSGRNLIQNKAKASPTKKASDLLNKLLEAKNKINSTELLINISSSTIIFKYF